MKKKISLLLLVGLLLTGCGKIPKLENGQEALLTFKNGDKISVDEFYQELKDTYGLSTVIGMIDEYVLEKSFPAYKEKAESFAKSYINAIKEGYDSDEKFLTAIQNNTGMATVEEYQHYIYLSYMQSYAVEEYAKKQITDKEIEKYYKNNIVGDIEVSHILITPDVNDKMTDDETKEAEKKAKEKAQNILDTLKKTNAKDVKTKFEELAKANSEDNATKDKGGSLGRINKDTLSKEYKELVDAAYTLKDGNYYSKVITTELGYHIILKNKSYDKASLDDSKDSIKTTLANKMLDDDKTLTTKALQHYRKEMGIDIQDSELKKQYANYMQNELSK